MDVQLIPGLAHLPFAEVWFHTVDEAAFDAASAAARELGRPGLEAWTTTATPEVVSFLQARGFDEVRRYTIAELDVPAASDPGPPAGTLVTFGECADLADELFALAQIACPEQPGRTSSTIDAAWFDWGLRASDPNGSFVALEDGRVAAYGSVQRKEEDGLWWHSFLAVAREHRSRGLAGAIKRAQIGWAKANGRRRATRRASPRAAAPSPCAAAEWPPAEIYTRVTPPSRVSRASRVRPRPQPQASVCLLPAAPRARSHRRDGYGSPARCPDSAWTDSRTRRRSRDRSPRRSRGSSLRRSPVPRTPARGLSGRDRRRCRGCRRAGGG